MLIIFSKKESKEMQQIMKQLQFLNLAYLISISGLQISLFNLIIKKILKRHQKTASYTILFFTFTYSFCLNFNVGIIRVLLLLITKNILKTNNKNILLPICGIITLILDTRINTNLGFIFGYIASYINWNIYKLQIKKIYQVIFVNLCMFTISIPMLFYFDNSVNLYSIILNYFFVLLYMFIFVYTFCLFLIPYLSTSIIYCQQILNLMIDLATLIIVE
jgi:ComEC/Rec2-related protein